MSFKHTFPPLCYPRYTAKLFFTGLVLWLFYRNELFYLHTFPKKKRMFRVSLKCNGKLIKPFVFCIDELRQHILFVQRTIHNDVTQRKEKGVSHLEKIIEHWGVVRGNGVWKSPNLHAILRNDPIKGFYWVIIKLLYMYAFEHFIPSINHSPADLVSYENLMIPVTCIIFGTSHKKY